MRKLPNGCVGWLRECVAVVTFQSAYVTIFGHRVFFSVDHIFGVTNITIKMVRIPSRIVWTDPGAAVVSYAELTV